MTIDVASKDDEAIDRAMRDQMSDWCGYARFSEIGFKYRVDTVVPVVHQVDYTEINKLVKAFTNSKDFLKARVDWRGEWCSDDALWFALVVAHTFKQLGQITEFHELVVLMDWDSYAEESFSNANTIWHLLEANEKLLSELLCYERGSDAKATVVEE
jgi:hypothetical protein